MNWRSRRIGRLRSRLGIEWLVMLGKAAFGPPFSFGSE
jgi:hypothetical protein